MEVANDAIGSNIHSFFYDAVLYHTAFSNEQAKKNNVLVTCTLYTEVQMYYTDIIVSMVSIHNIVTSNRLSAQGLGDYVKCQSVCSCNLTCQLYVFDRLLK